MKKIFLSILALATLFAVSCNKELSKDDISPVLSKGTIYKIKATVDEQTKTAYAGGKTFSWVSGDKIAVAISNPDGEVDFAEFSTSESGPVAEFSGVVEDYYRPIEGGYAVYPTLLNPTFLSNGLITVDYPSVWDARGLDDPLSILPLAASADVDGNYAFQHATGILQLSFTNIPEGAMEVYLLANGQALTGTYYIDLGEAGESYAQYDKTISDGWWISGTGYLNTSVYFDRPASGSATIYVPVPVGTLNAGLTISLRNSGGSTLYSKTTTKDIPVARKQIVALPTLDADIWQPLGTAKFNHYYFSGSYSYGVEVPIQYNTENPNQYRLVNPYGVLLPALGITQVSEPSDYLVFTLLQPGDEIYGTTITRSDLVNFEPVYTGYSADNYFMAHPSYLSGYDEENQYIYNRVIKYQEDGKTPANIELDGHRLYYTTSGSLRGYYCLERNLVMQIAFPGCDILDYTASLAYEGANQASSGSAPLIDFNVTLGADTEYALVAVASSEDDALEAVYGGQGTRVNASGTVTVSLPANSPTGSYFAAILTFADGQDWLSASSSFNYANPDEDKGYTIDDIVGTYDVSAYPLTTGSDENFTMVIAASDVSGSNVMITSFDGVPCSYASVYGNFDTKTGLVTFPADQIFYIGSSYAYGLRAFEEPLDLTFIMSSPGNLSTDQWVVSAAYNKLTYAYLGYFDVWADFVAVRNSSSTMKPLKAASSANPSEKRVTPSFGAISAALPLKAEARAR